MGNSHSNATYTDFPGGRVDLKLLQVQPPDLPDYNYFCAHEVDWEAPKGYVVSIQNWLHDQTEPFLAARKPNSCLEIHTEHNAPQAIVSKRTDKEPTGPEPTDPKAIGRKARALICATANADPREYVERKGFLEALDDFVSKCGENQTHFGGVFNVPNTKIWNTLVPRDEDKPGPGQLYGMIDITSCPECEDYMLTSY